MHQLAEVRTPSEIQEIVALAVRIWNQHFVPIIGQRQVDYMLQKFQSEEAIAQQISEGYQYYLLRFDEESVGYLSIRPNEPQGKMMISKIYVDSTKRGAGHGRFLLEFVESQSQKVGLDTIWLTVNKFNTETVNWYRRRGFTVRDEVKMGIGGGYYMDDFVMEYSPSEK